MTEVYGILTATNGRPLQHQTVKITLVAPGNQFTDQVEVIQTHTVDTGTTGRWTAQLIPNEEYEREGTWYRVDQRDGLREPDLVHDIVVPTGGPYWVRDLIVIPPTPGVPFPPLPPHALGDHADVDTTGAVAGRVLKFNGTEWVPAIDSGGGGGSGSAFEMVVGIPAQSITVPHALGYRPAGVRMFSADWLTEYDEFRVFHDSVDQCTVIVEQPFTGNITVS